MLSILIAFTSLAYIYLFTGFIDWIATDITFLTGFELMNTAKVSVRNWPKIAAGKEFAGVRFGHFQPLDRNYQMSAYRRNAELSECAKFVPQ